MVVTGADGVQRMCASACKRGRGQGGFTLLEAIVSLALVSTVVLTLAAGLLTTVRSSASAKGTQLVDGALSAYAESFKGSYPVGVSSPCPTSADFMSAANPPAWLDEDPAVVAYSVSRTEGWTKPRLTRRTHGSTARSDQYSTRE